MNMRASVAKPGRPVSLHTGAAGRASSQALFIAPPAGYHRCAAMPDTSAPLLPAEYLALMARGVSVIVASSSAARVPSLMRAVGSHVADGGRQVTVYVSRSQASQLLDDIASSGQVAVVFSSPVSHQTLQLKSSQVTLRPMDVADLPILQRYRESMEQEVGAVGFPPTFTRAMLAHRIDDVVAIGFRPEQAFDQSPGPRAGTPLLTGGAAT
jgi:hypothetical protein